MKQITSIIGFLLCSLPLFGAQQTINIGATGNDNTGDSARVAFGKVNTNFTELYALSSGLGATNTAKAATIAELVGYPLPNAATNVFVEGRGVAGDGAGGWFTYLSGSSTTTNLGTVFKPTGTTGRWVRQFSGSVNARWFGADNTGTDDVQTAVGNAITYLKSLSGGGSLFFPAGTYKLGSQLNTIGLTNVVFEGEGIGVTKFISTFNIAPVNSAAWQFQNASNITFRNFSMEGVGTGNNTAYELITFPNLSGTSTNGNIRFENLSFRHFAHTAIRKISAVVSKDLYIYNCIFVDGSNLSQARVSTGGAIKLEDLENVIVSGCYFENVGDSDLLWGIYGTDIEGCTFTGNTLRSGSAAGTGGITLSGYAVTITGNVWVGSPTNNVRSVFNSNLGLNIENNMFTYARCVLRNGTNVNFLGNTFHQPTNTLTCLDIDVNAINYLISGNNFFGDGMMDNGGGPPSRTAIRNLDDAGGVSHTINIIGNNCYEIGLATIERGTNHFIFGNRVYAPSFVNTAHGALRLVDTADTSTRASFNTIHVGASAMAMSAAAGAFASTLGNSILSGVTDSTTTNVNLNGLQSAAGVLSIVNGAFTGTAGTANYLPRWSAASPYLTTTSRAYDDGTAIIINGTTKNASQTRLQVFGAGTDIVAVEATGSVEALYKSTAAAVDGTRRMRISSQALDSGGNNTVYGHIGMTTTTTTDGSEVGSWFIDTANAGSAANRWNIGPHIVPAANNTYDVGSSALKLKTVWTTGADVSGSFTNSGTTVHTPSTLQTLSAGTAVLANATTIRVVGNGGAVTLTGTPTIADGKDGQEVTIFGTDDTNTVTFQDQGGLGSSNLELGAATRALGKGDILVLYFDTTTGLWWEKSFAAN